MSGMVEPFRAGHLLELHLQETQAGETRWRAFSEAGRQREAAGRGWTLRDADSGRVLFCGGAMEQHDGYASLWGFFARDRAHVTLWLTRTIRRFVAELPHHRVDAWVEASNENACEWLRLIGLRIEGTMRGAAADGGDLLVYSRIGA